MTHYVLVKGRFGMGGRIAVMLSAWHYARATGRELVVDWNDFSYYEPGVDDVFRELFARPRVSDAAVEDLAGLSTFPSTWSDRLLAYRNEDAATVMPIELFRVPLPAVDDREAAAADVVVVTNHLTAAELHPLYRELRLVPELNDRVEAESTRVQPKDRVGVQVRDGNGERLLSAPDLDWFYDQVDCAATQSLFVTSDSLRVVQAFEARYADVAHTAKWYPAVGSGPMHQNESCPDRLENAREAIVDLWLLARCQLLIGTGGFFGQTSRLLAYPAVPFKVYPGKIHPTVQEKHDAGWTNPI